MLTEPLAAEAVLAAGVDAQVHFLEVTDSTNADLLQLAEAGAPQWTVVVANHQRAGRGRLGRTWLSSPGSSLLCSVLLRPRLDPAGAAILGLAAGAAMATACGKAAAVLARCKWPNDLMSGGRKLGGVLAEARVQDDRLMHLVIGAGVNLTQGPDDFPPVVRSIATSVTQQRGRAAAGRLLTAYLVELRRLSDMAEAGSAGGVLDAYRGLCDTIGRSVRATTTSGEEVAGRAVGIGDGGELIVRTETGQERVGFGEIAHLD